MRQQAKPDHLEDDARWGAVVARDQTQDGHFVYSVASTGVYCRPSCPSRQAKRENVRFHPTPAAAEAQGFRACKRCRPDAASRQVVQSRLIAAACRSIEEAETPPRLVELARMSGLSPYHFHRVFKAATGVTPKAYASAVRRQRVQDALVSTPTATEAIHASGFASSGRFYAQSKDLLGMETRRFRTGGAGAEIVYATGPTSLGTVLVAASPAGVCAILIGDDTAALVRDLERRFAKAKLSRGDHAFARIVSTVIRHIENPRRALDLPLDVRGTAFQQQVWAALRRIPAGETRSYAEVAAELGRPAAVRAVAQACAANALAVAVPCHRVVRSDGALSGYRWGIERKRALIEREQGGK